MRGGFWLLLAAVVVLGGSVLLAVPRLEGVPPETTAPEAISLGASGRTVELLLADRQSGLRRLDLRLLHGAGSSTLREEDIPGSWITGGGSDSHERRLSIELDARALGAPDGTATLVLSVRDWSWRDALKGNRSEVSIPVRIDTRAPSVTLESGLTYVYRGGSAVAVYRVDERAPEHGVRVGQTFFPGYPHPTRHDLSVAFFAIPVEAPINPGVRVVAIDAAGNEGSTRFPAHVLERAFTKSRIDLDDAFLENVAMPLARNAGLSVRDPIDAFQKVNRDLRKANEKTIRETVSRSAPERHWRGAFGQLSGSKVMSRFAEERSYFLRGGLISEARHYGFDLASTARARVTAAGAGVVLFAGELGIYGRCVLLDHGLGLSSLYGHMSQIEVAVGEPVERGQLLGRSGATGLAGGDHLHFAILVGGNYVDPLEWWDPKWVRSHIEVRLRASGE